MSNARELAELGGSYGSGGFVGMKNRIINGAMMIDQRNAGASFTVTNTEPYTLDRWRALSSPTSKFSVQQTPSATETGYATRVAAGFTNYLAVTSLSAYSVSSGDWFSVHQGIEGLNVSDLAWGTANAKTVTVSFLVYSSLTGTFSGSIRNNAATRSYPFTFTISSTNTWTTCSVTIPGDQSGTWLTNNSTGLWLFFDMGSGSTNRTTANSWAAGNYVGVTGAQSVVATNGATFYITGVQLEKGSTATSFDFRSFGTELALCQRYYYKQTGSTYSFMAWGKGQTVSAVQAMFQLPVPMRIKPSLEYSALSGFLAETGATSVFSLTSFTQDTNTTTPQCIGISVVKTSAFTVGAMYWLLAYNDTTAYLAGSAEL